MKKILVFLLSTIMSFIFGGLLSASSGIDPSLTIGGALALSHGILPAISAAMPEGIAGLVVFKSAYEAELLKGLKSVSNGFLARVPDRSELLSANTINYTKIGSKPDVLIDNVTYPIPGGQRTDEGLIVSLRKLTTKHTVITRDEIHNLPYDKKGSVIDQHKEALIEKFNKLALYSFTPAAHTTTTPVLTTTGATVGSRKRLVLADLIAFRTALNKLGIGQCDLVLCDDHVEDILLWSQAFVSAYSVISSGLILPLYGFNMLQNQGYAPEFNAGTKKAFEAATIAGDVSASVAYLPARLFKAYGDVEMFETLANAEYHEDKVNFDAYFIAAPKDNEGRGAIISTAV